MSIAAAASTFAAVSIPLCAMPVVPAETICHEWPGIMLGAVTQFICPVGVCQLTSPTSVEPGSVTEE